MVLVHVEVAFGAEFEVEAAVASDLLEHVIEEADACGYVDFAAAVEIQAEEDVGLLGGSSRSLFS